MRPVYLLKCDVDRCAVWCQSLGSHVSLANLLNMHLLEREAIMRLVTIVYSGPQSADTLL
jgi:hypothetical protein